MANVMSLKKLKNTTSRNGFDLSKRNIFSAKVGELLPVYCKEVIPGDNFKINVKSFTRTMPVNTAAYTRIKEYYDWFFVPTNLLWNKFNTFVTQMVDNSQHAIDPRNQDILSDQHPYLSYGDLYNTLSQLNQARTNDLQNNVANTPYNNLFGYNRIELSCKLLEYLGYSDWFGQISSLIPQAPYAENPALNPFPILAYQKIYQDYFRDSQWEKGRANTFNIDYMHASNQSSSSYNFSIPLSHIFNDYSAGNTTMFDLQYCNWNKDLFMGVKPNSQFGDAASIQFPVTNYDGQGVAKIQLRSLANPDEIANAGNANKLSVSYGGSDNYVGIRSGEYHILNGSTYWDYPLDSIRSLASALGIANPNNLEEVVQQKVSILALRQAEALQKWKEITQSQQQDYKAQIEAHFGVSLSDAYSERCHYIDGFSDVIDINEVVNTNLVNDGVQNIADIAGKGVGVNDGYTSFSSDVHGYLMCIYHAVPLLDYSLTSRVPRQLLKTKVTDYAIPEFDKIGMVSVPMIEMTNDVELNKGQLIGYAPRYYDYKTDVDEIHGSARNRNSAWVAPFDDNYLKQLLFRGGQEIMPIDYRFFKVNPSIMDTIFVASAAADSSTESDQLLTNCMFDVKAVRNLDYDGLPY